MPDRSRALELVLQRIDTTAQDGPSAGFPHYADPTTGAWTRSPAGDWTGGFWIGQLWLAAELTGEGTYVDLAREWARALRPRAASETIFRGFLFWYGAAVGARLHGDELARGVACEGARGLATLFNPRARLIPLGAEAEEASDVGRSEANIDGVPGGTPLLAWAARETGDDRLRQIAAEHALGHVELCVREDGSVCQSASFDPRTGALRRRYTHKGVRADSTWTRAQAWAMLGFAQATHAGVDALEVARRVSDWWCDRVPDGGVAAWDFDDPAGPRDTSGTAIAAAALLKLAPLAPDRADRYRATASRMVDALVECHLTGVQPADRRPPGILADGCYNRRIGLATANELIWGSYFLLEALAVLAGHVDSGLI